MTTRRQRKKTDPLTVMGVIASSSRFQKIEKSMQNSEWAS
jgi:hypothetical protein